MRGHGEKLSRKQEAAIAALLTEPTTEAAAKAVGINPATLWRWMRLPDFTARYREARRRLLEGAMAALQRSTGEAAETLRRNLACGQAATEVRAALAMFELAMKGVELLDLEQRVGELETLLERQKVVRAKRRLV